MKREILFRGKRVCDGHFVNGSLVEVNGECDSNESVPHIVISYGPDTFDWFEVDPETVGQFIGITDIHGRKVFEGDILSCKKADGTSFEYKCVYNDENACFYFTNTKYGLSLSGDEMLYFDVIGNIHDLKLKL